MQSLHVYLEHRVFYWAVDHLNIYHIMKAAATNGRIADGLLYYADSNKQFPVPIIDAELAQKAISMAHGMMLLN